MSLAELEEIQFELAQRRFKARRQKAKCTVNRAVKAGKLKRGACAVCGKDYGRIEGHHYDYSKPLEVVWLCPRHHSLVHQRWPNVVSGGGGS